MARKKIKRYRDIKRVVFSKDEKRALKKLLKHLGIKEEEACWRDIGPWNSRKYAKIIGEDSIDVRNAIVKAWEKSKKRNRGGSMSGLGMWPFSNWYDGKTDSEIARKVFEYYVDIAQNVSKDVLGKQITFNANDLMRYYERERGNQIMQLGSGIRAGGVSWDDVKDGAYDLAYKMSGSYPKHISGFLNAISGQAVSTPAVDLVTRTQAVVTETVKPITTVVGLGETVNKYALPVLVVVGLGIAGYFISQIRSVAEIAK